MKRTERRRLGHGILGAGVVLTLALTGCGGTTDARGATSPTASGSSSASATGTAVTGAPAVQPADVAAILADYDARNNAAIAAAGQGFDSTAWADADTGAVLESDIIGTQLAKAQEDHGDATLVLTHADPVAYLPLVDAAQPWFLVRAALSDVPRLVSLTRAGAGQPWKVEASVELPSGVADPAAPGADSTVAATDHEQVQKAIASVIRSIDDPATDPGVFVGPLAEHRRHLDTNASGLGADAFTSTTTPYAGQLTDQGGPGGSTRVVRSADGSVLALASLRNRVVFTREGGMLEHGPDFAAVTGQSGPQPSLTYDFLVSVVIRLDQAGKVAVVGSSLGNLPVR